MKYKIIEFEIRNFRSILKLKIQPKEDNLLIICGVNNIGKTNFLRALHLFFNPIEDNFEPERDIPYHISEASRGSGYKTTLIGKIKEIESGKTYSIKQEFTQIKGIKKISISGKLDNQGINEPEIMKFLDSKFKLFFIEASNVNIPQLIKEIVNDEILPLSLDRRRGKEQQDSLNKLDDFIKQSKVVVEKIENELTKILIDLLDDIDSLDVKKWKLKINFPEYNYLREAISNMITFTLFDTNEHSLDTKGSGIQRSILLSLIKYVNTKTRKDVIWAIDEPEAFLQAGLQKNLFKTFTTEATNSQLIITTHSQFFIDINNLANTYLFESFKEEKPYKRKNNTIYFKLDTKIFEGEEFEKAEKIKENFGLQKNDNWEIMPFNILVEGQEDKDYLIGIYKLLQYPIPNILSAGGVNKFSGYLQFINDYCSDMSKKPCVIVLYDKDSAGRSEFASLDSPKKKGNLSNIRIINKYIIKYDGSSHNDIEIEDLIPLNLVFDAANKIIRKKGFSTIKQEDRNKKTLPVYQRKPILGFLNEICKQRNTDKSYEIDFESLDNKLMLCKNICNLIENNQSSKDEILNNSSIKQFIKELNSNANRK